MGLLDDAIREHLELKRRRGADPVEVAREQHEALATDPALSGDGADDRAGAPSEVLQTQAGADNAAGTEETAELDMNAVLDDGAQDATGASPGDPLQADALDETPDVIQPIPGQEHLNFEQSSPADSEPTT